MWTGTDEYLDGVWQRYQRALKLIEEYKDSPVEDIRFIAEYLDELIKDNFREQEENTKRFKVINLLHAERNDYIQYSKWLEERVLRLAEMSKHDLYPQMVEGKKAKIFNYDYDKKYNENKLSWTDLTRRN